MMTQEEFMDVLAMKRRGMSFKEIGDELGYHPATIAKWVKAGGPTTARPRSNRLTDAPAGAPMRMGQPAPGAARRPAASASPAT